MRVPAAREKITAQEGTGAPLRAFKMHPAAIAMRAGDIRQSRAALKAA
jgi:hypothetical protein